MLEPGRFYPVNDIANPVPFCPQCRKDWEPPAVWHGIMPPPYRPACSCSIKLRVDDVTIDDEEPIRDMLRHAAEKAKNAEEAREFRKDDTGKLRYDLLPPRALHEVVKVLTHGAYTYGAYNWKKGFQDKEKKKETVDRFLAACYRHVESYRMGHEIDGDSDLHPLSHAIVSLLFILASDLGDVEDA